MGLLIWGYNAAVALKFILGVFTALLPPRWRGGPLSRLAPTSAQAVVSGALQILLCLGWLVRSYFHFMSATIAEYIRQASSHGGGGAQMVEFAGGVAVAYGMGFTALFAFLLRWQSVAACYFAFEG